MWVTGLIGSLYAGASVGLLWGLAPWWVIVLDFATMMVVWIGGMFAGISLGRLSVFRDISEARVKATFVDIEEDGQ